MRNQFIFIAIFIGTLYSQCDSYILSECDSNSNCEWIEDTSYASCSSLGTGNSSFCDAQANCSYSWLTYSCGGGTYEVDNSYCEEIEVLDCSEMDEPNYNIDDSCEWVEEIDSISCYSLSEMNCGQVQGCNWGCSDWGDWYTWICYEYTCQGGTGQMDNSYCEEIQYLLGDVTGDFSINVLDVIQIVNLILNNEYNMIVDMNNDNQLNVLDVILVVDIILGN